MLSLDFFPILSCGCVAYGDSDTGPFPVICQRFAWAVIQPALLNVFVWLSCTVPACRSEQDSQFVSLEIFLLCRQVVKSRGGREVGGERGP